MKKIFFISTVATIFLTSCRQWYSLQNFLGIGHYEIVSNTENWLDNNGSVEKYWGCFFCFMVFCIFAL